MISGTDTHNDEYEEVSNYSLHSDNEFNGADTLNDECEEESYCNLNSDHEFNDMDTSDDDVLNEDIDIAIGENLEEGSIIFLLHIEVIFFYQRNRRSRRRRNGNRGRRSSLEQPMRNQFIRKRVNIAMVCTFFPLVAVKESFPNTLYKLNNLAIEEKAGDSFAKVVCPSTDCNAVYDYQQTFFERDGVNVAKKCSGMEFSKECGEVLLHTKRLSHNKTTLVPYKVYMYKSPTIWLKEVLQSEVFRSLLSMRFNRDVNDMKEDIWDGDVWKEFSNDTNGPSFLSQKYNIAFMLFVDWVKPYKRSQYSIGTVYLSVLNLPRSQRLLKRWMNVVGIIPGPTEPKKHMNTYLKPLVEDLIQLWEGVEVQVLDTKEIINVRAMLLCVSSDIPALRKVTQFLSYTANKGCNMCNFMGEREKGGDGEITRRMSYLAKDFAFESRTNQEV
eukprot:Seg1671.3 transcript_id=Seg1671.3/GoldUCD/mRNA.D3Y31 product="hypothetical protein" protein_id=Seg1671.3/GoldUCD/D3Y31